ncbi:D-alanyl-D-alanine carboxypeptidase/D-alanyl-D-alanine-endopeptidase [Knoellia locipacati]|uniref:D-alanyl-D-alanine carboxypeptidase n=1 Tax=Knoellia locipacati TaxID=882824 RepID=A0A512T0X5_9MICO|nr:D-alanyl-D-alanine carboxypeptidase [Knoellia locipacati]GEQ13829.1 D-alanyl-D-alanine carboxypeptidase [Knoellia locipacati]
MRRAVVAGVTLLLVGGVGYAAADVVDLAPGILTYDGAPVAPPTPTGSASASPAWAALPSAAPATATPSPTATAAGAAPTTAGLTKALAAIAKDPWLGPSVGISVRDGVTGAELYAVSPGVARAPASTLKVLSAFAVTKHVDLDAHMTTRVVTGDTPTEIVLVAGGDTLLGSGASDPHAVEGHAGLATLADEVAQSLTDRGAGAVTLRVDATYAAGPRYPATWKKEDIAAGFTQSVSMLDMVSQRAGGGRAAPAVPETGVAAVLAKALTARGHATTVLPLSGHGTPAPAGATELGAVESATYADHLGFALQHSDNALTENLVRQAMVAAGASPAAPLGPPQFVVRTLADAGVPTAGLRLLDVSGLSPGQTATATALADVVALGATGKDPAFLRAVASFPVAGLTGSLSDRYRGKETGSVAGIPRAKTGTLRGISSLAGTTVDADGHLLVFAVLTDRVPASSGTLGARAALDRFVTALTMCGCH